MSDPQEFFAETFEDLTRRVANEDITGDSFTTAAKNLKLFSEISAPTPTQHKAEPTTRLGKLKASVGRFWESPTTQALIKAGGAFGGVYYVTRQTVKRDHVIERQALDQARQRPVQ